MSVPAPSPGKPLLHFHPTHLIVHYNEVALKGKNRSWFEEMLARNIRSALAGTGSSDVRRLFGRLLVRLGEETAWPHAAAQLRRVFGIAHVLPVLVLEPELEAIKKAAGQAVSGEEGQRTFGVECKRATKDFPFNSMDVQREVGSEIQAITGWPVNLDEPDLPVRVEIVNKAAFLGFHRVDGPGGLPTGVSGRAVCLLSGGIDSPVAAYRVLRRGATVSFVHFHSHPHTGIESQEKVRELAERIQPIGRSARLYMVPFAELQRKIVSASPAPLRVILYRRFMVRAADLLARRERALALVTGENLGQVASQTLENLRVIDAVSTLPILRPLIGMDKLEIVAEAKRIGTFETSIEPHGDCCSFLMPPNPATSSTPEELEEAESGLEVDAEVDRLVADASVEEIESAPLSLLEGRSPERQ
jgi:thiamine biosynthesis protein ThiI